MSDRLAELRRQRALVQEHLAWLDREIAAATTRERGGAGSPNRPEFQPPSPLPTFASPSPLFDSTASAPTSAFVASPTSAADPLLDQYRIEPTAVRADVRKGCFLYFAAAFVLLILVVGILYVTLSSR